MTDRGLPFITIVMPVRNEEQFVGDTLGDLLNLDYPSDRFEIIVVDGESTDRTGEVVRSVAEKYPQVVIISNPGRLSSSGRNVGFRNGKGDIFLVVDGHCKVENNHLLKNIVKCFEKSGAQCLGRPQPLDPQGLSDFQKAVSFARASRFGHSSHSFIYSEFEGFVSPVSNGAIYKKEVFKRVGYVDESFDACEDVEFNYRVEKAGFKTYMSPLLAMKYYPRKNLTALFRQMKRYGEGRFNFIRKHPEALNLDMLKAPLFAIGILMLPIFLLLHISFHFSVLSFILWLISIIYGLYALLIFTECARVLIKNGLKYAMHMPFIFFSIHFGLGWGFIRMIFLRR